MFANTLVDGCTDIETLKILVWNDTCLIEITKA